MAVSPVFRPAAHRAGVSARPASLHISGWSAQRGSCLPFLCQWLVSQAQVPSRILSNPACSQFYQVTMKVPPWLQFSRKLRNDVGARRPGGGSAERPTCHLCESGCARAGVRERVCESGCARAGMRERVCESGCARAAGVVSQFSLPEGIRFLKASAPAAGGVSGLGRPSGVFRGSRRVRPRGAGRAGIRGRWGLSPARGSLEGTGAGSYRC